MKLLVGDTRMITIAKLLLMNVHGASSGVTDRILPIHYRPVLNTEHRGLTKWWSRRPHDGQGRARE